MNWNYKGYADVPNLPTNAKYVASIPNGGVNWPDVVSTLEKASNYHRILRTINEPEIASQGNMSPGTAYNLIKNYLAPLTVSHGYRLCSPSVTSGPNGVAWLKQFYGLGGDSKISITDFHFYGISSKDFATSVDDFAAFGHPLVITEIGAMDYYHWVQATSAQFNDVFYNAMKTCQQDSRILLCMWFGFFTSNELPNSLGSINSLLECPNPNDNKACKPNGHGLQYLSS